MDPTLPFRISLYENEVPPFAEAELERLYGTVYSSLAHFRIMSEVVNISTYVVHRGDEITVLLLFRREKKRIDVMNERIELAPEEVARFAAYIFASVDAVSFITFNALLISNEKFSIPYQKRNCGESIVASLPDTVADYVARLGSATRKNIKRHKNRLEREFPSFQFFVSVKDAVNEQHVREIIGFNKIRMASKGKVSVIDEAWTQWLMRLVRQRGLVTVATINGRVCGGAVTVRIGDTFISHVNAHDPVYNDFRLGTICCFMTICECIERGAKRFDFLWGQYEYKTALLGQHHYLYRYILYRSPLHLALNCGVALSETVSGNLREAKLWLLEAAKQDEGGYRHLIGRCVNFVRNMKKALVALRNR